MNRKVVPYSRIRQFYAWVGFLVTWGLVIALIAHYVLPKVDPQWVYTRSARAEANITIPAVVTEYTSSVNETDSTPLVNAAGTRPHDGSLACPSMYRFGTKVVIEGNTYTCDDRMAANRRGDSYFDVWVHTKTEAFDWGKKILTITILQ